MNKLFAFVICVLLLTSLIVSGGSTAPAQAQTPQKPPELPKIMSIGTYSTGTASYIQCSAFREVLEKLTPMKVRLEPVMTETEAMKSFKGGSISLWLQPETTATQVSYGLEPFNTAEWGPQPLRLVFRGSDWLAAPLVAANSSIKTMADLKGKKVPYAEPQPIYIRYWTGILAFANLKWDDVVKVPRTGYADALNGVLQGNLDVTWSVNTAPAATELAASSKGLRWLPLTHSDASAWKRLQEHCPFFKPGAATLGAGIKQGESIQMAKYFNALWTMDNIDEYLIYTWVKSIHQGYETLKDMHPDLKFWTIENTLEIPALGAIPFHPGSIKYFKEIGKWTPAHEQWQKEHLDSFNKRVASFKQK